MKRALLGGTFDPPHLAHLVAGEAAYRNLGVDVVTFMPAGRPWQKSGNDVTAAEHRWAMTELAVEGVGYFEADDREVHRDGWTYTAPAGSFLANEFGGADLVGNVREWVADCFGEPRALEGVDYTPVLAGSCGKRVVKGTAWLHGEGFDDPARRLGFDSDAALNTVGFRLVRTLD